MQENEEHNIINDEDEDEELDLDIMNLTDKQQDIENNFREVLFNIQ